MRHLYTASVVLIILWSAVLPTIALAYVAVVGIDDVVYELGRLARYAVAGWKCPYGG